MENIKPAIFLSDGFGSESDAVIVCDVEVYCLAGSESLTGELGGSSLALGPITAAEKDVEAIAIVTE